MSPHRRRMTKTKAKHLKAACVCTADSEVTKAVIWPYELLYNMDSTPATYDDLSAAEFFISYLTLVKLLYNMDSTPASYDDLSAAGFYISYLTLVRHRKLLY